MGLLVVLKHNVPRSLKKDFMRGFEGNKEK